MKLRNIIILSCTAFLSVSCSDFLDLKPLSDNSAESFFTAENQLEAYCNQKYEILPDHGFASTDYYGRFSADANSDNQAGYDANDNFMPQRTKVPEGNSYSNHNKLRDINLFLSRVEENLNNGSLKTSVKVQQYTGEMLFFRAYIYFEYLKSFGDFPILTTVLTDADYSANVEANKRKPRNEVARFILQDLDNAIGKLQSGSGMAQRINRESALLFKSRVALYEASWETYHKGTARVPGGTGWPGGSFNGNLDTEISFFLTQAMEAAKQVADAVPTLDSDYAGLFNKENYTQKEILLWRMYSTTAKVLNFVVGTTHGFEKNMGVNGGRNGYTRSLVESFLMTNGLPIYAAGSNYQGDKSLADVVKGRDERLTSSMAKPGDKIRGANYFNHPALVKTGSQEVSTTGYIIRKGWMDNDIDINQPFPLGLPIFRAAEAYLNYMEANYMKNGSLDENSQKYWKALRKRAGVSEDYQATIDNTDLNKEIDLGKYSGSNTVDKTLYNIRRERRCEFIAEGMRKDDLYRWRSLDMMKNYQTEGFNYWDEAFNNPAYQTFSPVKLDNSPYLYPYGKNAIAKDGYNFEVANYLSPLAYDIFRLSTPEKGGDVSTSVVYQNPGWPVEIGAYAIQ